MERLLFDKKLPLLAAKDISHSRLGIGFEKLDRDTFDPNKAYDKLAQIGVKHIRIQSGWARTEKEKGVYDFAWLDDIVDNIRSRGMEPWLDLCYGNPLYTPLAIPVFGAVGCPPISTEEEMQAWLCYVDATVRHYTGKIHLYEIWNEPDGWWSWRHDETDTKENMDLKQHAYEYGIFADRTAQTIKAADSNARVAAGSIAHPAQNLYYIDDILATGLYKHIDALTYHIYSAFDGERGDIYRAIRSVVDRYNPKITLIQGEAGAQTRSDGSGAMKGFAWSRAKQTKYLLRTLICDLWHGVEFPSYFSTMDMIEGLHGRLADKASFMDFGYFGVLSADFDENGKATGEYTPKPSYYALQSLATLLQGDCQRYDLPYIRQYMPSRRVNGVDCEDTSLRTYGFKLHDGTVAMAYWNCVPILTHTYEGTVSYCICGEKTDNIRLLDPADGSIYKLPDSMLEQQGANSILLKNLPLTDSPLIVLFG